MGVGTDGGDTGGVGTDGGETGGEGTDGGDTGGEGTEGGETGGVGTDSAEATGTALSASTTASRPSARTADLRFVDPNNGSTSSNPSACTPAHTPL